MQTKINFNILKKKIKKYISPYLTFETSWVLHALRIQYQVTLSTYFLKNTCINVKFFEIIAVI